MKNDDLTPMVAKPIKKTVKVMELKDKVALVLGAVKGIGKGIGLALAEQGAKVALNYFDWEESLDELKLEKTMSCEKVPPMLLMIAPTLRQSIFP